MSHRWAVAVLLLLAACGNGEGPETIPDVLAAGQHPGAAFLSVAGTAADDVWVVGADPGSGGKVLHWHGSAWSELPNPWRFDLWWVHVFGPSTVMFAGAGATILSWDGTTLQRHRTPGLARDTVYGLWGAAPDDVWAVGGWAGRSGFVWHYDGTSWEDVRLPDDLPLDPAGELPAFLKVWGRGPDDVWVVGGHGTVLHKDAGGWSVVPSGTTARLFTVSGNETEVTIVGGSAEGVVLRGDERGLTDVTPAGAPVLQGVTHDPQGNPWITGADARIWHWQGEWRAVSSSLEAPESLHGAWHDGRSLWAVGGAVLSGALDRGVIWRTDVATAPYAPVPVVPAEPVCPPGVIDRVPDGSIARRWNEQLLDSIRRDIPRPGVHARNLFHVSVAMWDAWAAYDTTADGYLPRARLASADPNADRAITISHAAYRVLRHRYEGAIGGAVSVACYDAFMRKLGLDPADDHVAGDDPVAVGNAIGQAVIEAFANDGANEAAGYADTTGWTSTNVPLVVDATVLNLADPELWTPLNIGLAETQNGIVLPSGLQAYVGPNWGHVQWFATAPAASGARPSLSDPELLDAVVEVIRKTSWLDVSDATPMDISPGAYGNNPVGSNAGIGHPVNPVTGLPYAPNVVKRSDFGRVLAEFWADGPRSETPPGHWNVIANDVSDDLDPANLRIGGTGVPVDRLRWDVSLYLAINGAVHDAAITAWNLKRLYTSARPIQLIRFMAHRGQRSDPGAPGYDPEGLPLVPGLIELVTPESSAPGQRHEHLRWFLGAVAVNTWRGEPGDRAHEAGGNGWIRAIEWIPYQRRTFVTPAFPGYVSGHSTFSSAAARVMDRFTGSPYFPGGLGQFTARPNAYLVFEAGPSETTTLQWATYYDAADQAGQSRIWGGIHVWPDDRDGRILGRGIGNASYEKASSLMDGTFSP